MSNIQAIILVGEPEDVVKALRDYMGKAPAMAVIGSPEVHGSAETGGESTDDALVSFIKRVLTRSDLAPRHRQLLQALYGAGESGMMRADLIRSMGLTAQGLQGVVGPLGRRVASTQGHDELAAADGQHDASGLLLEFRRIDNDWNYSLRPATRRALEELHFV